MPVRPSRRGAVPGEKHGTGGRRAEKEMRARSCLSVVLAAGEGTRMRSQISKVLHAVGGRSLIAHVLAAVTEADGAIAVVIGPGHDEVAAEVKRIAPAAQIFVQDER